MKELKIKKCTKCGAMVKVLADCNCEDCGISCCGETMRLLKANSTDATVEKHVPNYEINNDKIIVRVNHVMEEDHYIMWLCMVTDTEEIMVSLEPNKEAMCEFNYQKGAILYSYCNKHGLWKTEVE